MLLEYNPVGLWVLSWDIHCIKQIREGVTLLLGSENEILSISLSLPHCQKMELLLHYYCTLIISLYFAYKFTTQSKYIIKIFNRALDL